MQKLDTMFKHQIFISVYPTHPELSEYDFE